jgi:Cytochrome c biogenesis factor
VLGRADPSGGWQLRLWWKPFVTLIWAGGAVIAIGGALALLGRILLAAAAANRLAGAVHMSRGLRLIPIILLLWLVVGLAWRLVKPANPAIPSQLVNRPVPPFVLPSAIDGKPGLATADLAGQPRLLNIFASWCVPCISEVRVLDDSSDAVHASTGSRSATRRVP